MSEDWTESEIDAAVADYFGMLGDELASYPFVKLARYRSSAARIPRNIKSIERKHQNISAIKRDVSNGCLWRKPTSSAGGTGGNDDVAEIDAHQLEYPATTNAARLAGIGAHIPSDQMMTAFSTNKSIQVISNASRRDL